MRHNESLRTAIYMVVRERLDPGVEKSNLERAYDTLIHLASTTTLTQPPIDQAELEDLCDLYRTLLVTSLLLRLHFGEDHYDEATCSTLQASIERCFLLLQILALTPNVAELANRLPKSRHPLLNALIEEPLVPLEKLERQELWLSVAEDDDDNEEDAVVDGCLPLPDKKQLALEEKELIGMAQRPIPDVKTLSQQQQHQRQHLPTDVLVQQGEIKMFRCGVLRLEDGSVWQLSRRRTTLVFEKQATTLRLQYREGAEVVIDKAVSLWKRELKQALDASEVRENLCLQAEDSWKA